VSTVCDDLVTQNSLDEAVEWQMSE